MGKRLGQHFLRCKDIAKEMVSLSSPTRWDVALEIGCGNGEITEELLYNYKTVIGIEKDASLYYKLLKRFENEIKEGRLILLNKDFREMKEEELKNKVVVSSIPYYISYEILEKIVKGKVKRAVLLVQDEFAKKVVAERGKHYTFLSFYIQLYYIPIYIKQIPPSCFSPPPKVNSAIIKMIRRKKALLLPEEESKIINIAKALFNHKNKKISKAMKITLQNTPISLSKIPTNSKRVREMDVYELVEYLRNI